MRELSLRSLRDGSPTILFLGAHCDDIEIGCGATILRLRREAPDAVLKAVVLSSTDERRAEAMHAARGFLGETAASRVRVESFRDGFLPYDGGRVKDLFETLKREIEPDVIFTHYREDRHQDHRLVSDLTWNTWRDHLILEYEVPKYDGDLGRPSAYVPATRDDAERKIAMILEAFPSQCSKDWLDGETLRGLMRLRGVEARAPEGLAEAFYARKLRLEL